MRRVEVAAGMIGFLAAASAVLGLLAWSNATSADPNGAAPSSAAPTASSANEEGPAAAATVALPDIPRQSTALEDQGPAPAAPTRVEVPSLGIDVAVQPVGLDDRGQMGLIEDPAIAAWYQFGPAPASGSGSTVIAAHVDSLTYDVLPFARLRDAAPGTEIFVSDTAGTRHRYAVQNREVIVKEEVDWNAAFDRSGAPRLTLITCGGDFDYETRRYLSNLVLTATPIG